MFRKNGMGRERVAFDALENRRLMASAVNVVNTGGQVEDVVEANGQVYVSSRHGSGSAVGQIYVANGVKKKTKMLLDLSVSGSQIGSIDHLAATEDGRVFFTASAAGGRHVFELNTSTGGYTQITSGTSQSYNNVTGAGKALFFYESNGKTIYRLGPGAKTAVAVKQQAVDSEFVAAGSTIFFTGPDQHLYRCNGTAAGTVNISGNITVGRLDFFTTNEQVYFEGKSGNDTSLYRTSVTGTSPQIIAQDFSIPTNSHAELGEYVYFSGGYYNTSPKAKGQELYRVRSSDGVVEVAADVNSGSASGWVDGIAAVGNNIYFVQSDGEYVTSQGTYDRELYRYDVVKKKHELVTKTNTLYPIEVGGGVLGSYYFVAAPTKDNARFGSRALYRTNPVTDEVELINGLPTVKDSNGKEYQKVSKINVGSRGLFFVADTGDMGRDTDVLFVATPFSTFDPKTTILNIEGTSDADVLTMKVDGSELVVTLNGVEERLVLSQVKRIEAYLKDGNDNFASDPNVLVNTYVFGDLGDDTITTGGGQDTITGGAGKNFLYGGGNNDRLNGSGGRDYLDGQEGDDRLYGNGGSDQLLGSSGVDRLFGGDGDDILSGGSSNDKLYGEAGNDFLYGGNQSDLMFGGDGDDVLEGSFGDDTLDGGAGKDQMIGNEGNDVFLSKDGERDSLYGNEGTDTSTADALEALIDAIEVLN